MNKKSVFEPFIILVYQIGLPINKCEYNKFLTKKE